MWSVVFYYVWLIKDVVTTLFFPDLMQHQLSAYKTYMDMSPEGVTFFFTHGTVMEVLSTNWHNLFWRYFDLLPAGRLSKILALFLFGYYLMSIGYFKNLVYSKKLLTFYIVAGLFFTIISNIIGGSMSTFSSSFSDIAYKALAVTGQILLAMAYISILAHLYEMKPFKKILHSFSFVGRMSFSNYIMHTVFGYLIFYPFFGHLFGTMGIVQITALAVALYLLQIFYSYLWLKYFKFGPLEWLWRCLTYKKLFPIRLHS
jgi:uncharacterized protein